MSNPAHSPKSHRFFLGTVCIFAAAPLLKISDVQILEIFFFFHLLWLTLQLIHRKFRIPFNRLAKTFGIGYSIFFIVTLLLAFASLRFRFYPPPSADTFVKQPFILSLARSVELFLGVFHMIYIVCILRNNPAERMYALRFYFWVGIATCCYSLISVPANLFAGLDLGVYTTAVRARGSFNEGGPYGLYLVTILVAGILLYRIGGLTKSRLIVVSPVFLITFFLAQSKAALSACLMLFLLNIFVAGSARLRLSLVATGGIVGIAILSFTNFARDFMVYVDSYMVVQQVGALIDQSVYGGFAGRVAGAILVPRMIVAHPLTGVGLGNYPLLFNDPHYLQGLPPTLGWEAPGMGILGYLADFGIPLFLYLAVLLCVPPYMAYRRRSLPIVLIFAAVQPLTHLFGVQLNFYYPWICSGLALSFLDRTQAAQHPRTSGNALEHRP